MTKTFANSVIAQKARVYISAHVHVVFSIGTSFTGSSTEDTPEYTG